MAFAIASAYLLKKRVCTAQSSQALQSQLWEGLRPKIGGPQEHSSSWCFGIVANHGVDGLFMCTLMAGFYS